MGVMAAAQISECFHYYKYFVKTVVMSTVSLDCYIFKEFYNKYYD